MIRHLVALNFRDDTTQETKDQLIADLAGLSGHIDGIIDFQARPNVSVEDPVVADFVICSGLTSAMRGYAMCTWKTLHTDLSAQDW